MLEVAESSKCTNEQEIKRENRNFPMKWIDSFVDGVFFSMRSKTNYIHL